MPRNFKDDEDMLDYEQLLEEASQNPIPEEPLQEESLVDVPQVISEDPQRELASPEAPLSQSEEVARHIKELYGDQEAKLQESRQLRDDRLSNIATANAFGNLARAIGGRGGQVKIDNSNLNQVLKARAEAGANDAKHDAARRRQMVQDFISDKYKAGSDKFRSDQLGETIRHNKAMEGLAGQKANNPKQTEFTKTRDREAAKRLNKWSVGERDMILSDIQKLRDVEKALSSGANLTGSLKGRLPFQDITNPEGKENRTKIESVTQKNLREILGGQFAQKEGEQLLQRSYDPTMDEKYNLERVRSLRKAMEDAAAEKDRQLDWLENEGQGSMEGYQSIRTKPSGETKTVNGVTYQKVDGGWKKI